MAVPNDDVSMALFCDFENVALGVRDAKYEKFDIKPVLERLLLKGSIVVKKAYCDWERYKGFKAAMHEANFELIEIPHVRQSGKNSADIRLVVDALDLCYTKSHVNTFVIISGDSDFSPLVSKLRENAKQVIGVGVKQSTSDLLIANCDEFIFYDDLVRESQRSSARRDPRDAQQGREKLRKDELEARRAKAIEIAVETFEALMSERGDSGKIWASMLKEAIKRRKPDFSESYYGFRAFGNLLDEAQARGLLEVGRDEKSGAYVSRSSAAAAPRAAAETAPPTVVAQDAVPAAGGDKGERQESRRKGRGGHKQGDKRAPEAAAPMPSETAPTVEAPAAVPELVVETVATAPAVEPPKETKKVARPPRKRAKKVQEEGAEAPAAAVAQAGEPVAALLSPEPATPAKAPEAAPEAAQQAAPKAARKPATRKPRARKTVVSAEGEAGAVVKDDAG